MPIFCALQGRPVKPARFGSSPFDYPIPLREVRRMHIELALADALRTIH